MSLTTLALWYWMDGHMLKLLPLFCQFCLYYIVCQLLMRVFCPRCMLHQLVIHLLNRLSCCVPCLNVTEERVQLLHMLQTLLYCTANSGTPLSALMGSLAISCQNEGAESDIFFLGGCWVRVLRFLMLARMSACCLFLSLIVQLASAFSLFMPFQS